MTLLPEPMTDAPQVRGRGMPGCDLLVGLHSFPKSGNTWLRAILAGIIGLPADRGRMAEYLVDIHMGQRIGQRPWRFAGRTWCFYKSHNMDPCVLQDGQVIHPDRIFYIYRHPLDVFMSYLNYLSGNVTALSGKVFGFAFDRVEDLTPDQMEQLFRRFLIHGTFDPRAANPFGNLFDSIDRFRTLQAQGQPVHVLRYEDLSDDFDAAVQGICAFLELPLDPGGIERIRGSADSLTSGDGRFFWKRKVGTHASYLTAGQIDRFWDRHGHRMKALGYER